MEKTIISGRGAIIVPPKMREQYRLEDDALVVLTEVPEGILIRRLPPDFFEPFLSKHASAVPDAKTFAAWAAEDAAREEARVRPVAKQFNPSL